MTTRPSVPLVTPTTTRSDYHWQRGDVHAHTVTCHTDPTTTAQAPSGGPTSEAPHPGEATNAELRDVVLAAAALAAAWEAEARDTEPDPTWRTARARDQRRHLQTLRATAAALRQVLSPAGQLSRFALGPTRHLTNDQRRLLDEQPLLHAVKAVIAEHHGIPEGSPVVWQSVQSALDVDRPATRLRALHEALHALPADDPAAHRIQQLIDTDDDAA